jgi:hypothetical protein
MEDTEYQADQAASQEPSPQRGLHLPPQVVWPAAALPPGLAIISWALGGDQFWLLSTVFGAVVLIAVGLITVRGDLERRRKKEWLLLGYLALLWAPWAAVGYFFPIQTVKIAVLQDEPSAPLRISYNDEPLTTLDTPRNWSFPVRGHFQMERLKVETFGPSGWAPRRLRKEWTPPHSLQADEHSVALEHVQTINVYVDNRKHGVATLELGELKIVISAEKAEQRRIVAPLPGSPVAVRVDGVAAGQLGDQPALIDVLGTRTYHFQEVQYWGGTLLGALVQPEAIERVPPLDKIYRGNRLHVLPHNLQYFLEKAPSEIKVSTVSGMPLEGLYNGKGASGVVSRYQLTEVE